MVGSGGWFFAWAFAITTFELIPSGLAGGFALWVLTIQAWIVGTVHLTHVALADGREVLIGSEFVAFRKRHT
jgi:hypothetical protein